MTAPRRPLPASTVVAIGLLGLAVLTVAHVVNAATFELRMLDFDKENNLPTWYASAHFLLAAVALAGAGARASSSRAQVAFFGVALLALAFSVDETASMHEVAGHRLGAEPTLSFTQPAAALLVFGGLWLAARAAGPAAGRWLRWTAGVLVFSQACASVAGLWLDGAASWGVETVEDATETLVAVSLLASGLAGMGYRVAIRSEQLAAEWRGWWGAPRPAPRRAASAFSREGHA